MLYIWITINELPRLVDEGGMNMSAVLVNKEDVVGR